MSLNFVSSSVLSSTDGITHNTETPIENPTSTQNGFSRSSSNYSTSTLFEQLRKNQQDEQDQYDEVTKAMRGTRTLDDEDVAHLESVENANLERERLLQRKEDEELQVFRAAKLEKEMITTSEVLSNEDNNNIIENVPTSTLEKTNNDVVDGPSSLASLRPKIILTKKRRRRVTTSNTKTLKEEEEGKNCPPTKTSRISDKEDGQVISNEIRRTEKSVIDTNNQVRKEGLGGLLGDYGSDSDSD